MCRPTWRYHFLLLMTYSVIAVIAGPLGSAELKTEVRKPFYYLSQMFDEIVQDDLPVNLHASSRTKRQSTNSAGAACDPYHPIHLYGDGELDYPGGDQYYSNNQYCIWKIHADDEQYVGLHFTKLDIQRDHGVCRDILGVFDDRDQLITTFCGNQLPGDIMLPSNEVTLIFYSDSSIRSTGFTLNYGADGDMLGTTPPTHGACGSSGPLAVDTRGWGSILYPEQLEESYESNSDCQWLLTGTEGKNLRLDISTSIEKSPDCNKDSLQVFEGTQLVMTICGWGTKTIVANGNQLMLKFHSDEAVTALGFSVTYRDVDEPPTVTSSSLSSSTTSSTTTTTTSQPTTSTTSSTTSASTGSCGVRPSFYVAAMKAGNSKAARSAVDAPVVGGDEAVPYSWPWQVTVKLGSYHYCGGSIIHPNWIITAAHCVSGRVNGDISVVAGAHDQLRRESSEQQRPVDAIIIHEHYSSSTQDNDIALLRLSNPLVYNDQVQPVCLDDNMPSDQTTCFVTGWGNTESAVENRWRLRQAEVPMIERSTCNQPGWYYGRVTSNQFCAGYEQGGIDTCQGDSGGPLSCQKKDGSWTLVGLTSWGSGCADPYHPGVYTQVANYKDWMDHKIYYE